MKQAYRSASENPECSWLHSKMEDLFSEALPSAERERAGRHVTECAPCREEVESLRAIDPLIKNVLRYRAVLAAAPAPRRLHAGRAFGAFAAALGVMLLAVALWNSGQPQAAGPSIAENSGGPSLEKSEDPTENDVNRIKPEDNSPEPPQAPGKDAQKSGAKGPASGFAVINAAGYERSLADFRGRVLLIGVLAPRQPKAAANLERLYRTFGTQVQLLAIAENRKDPTPRDTTFPIVYNNGSDLLGAREAEYAVVDRAGAVVSRGSLIGDPNAIINTVGAAIKPLNDR